MLNAIVGALLGAAASRALAPGDKPATAKKLIGPHALDDGLSEQQERVVWRCWAEGTQEQREDLAKKIGGSFPIAASALLGRCWVLARRAELAAKAEAAKKVQPKIEAPKPKPKEDKDLDAAIERELAKQNGQPFSIVVDAPEETAGSAGAGA